MVKSLKVESEYRHGKHLKKSALNGLDFFVMQYNLNDLETVQWNGCTNRMYSIRCELEEYSEGGGW